MTTIARGKTLSRYSTALLATCLSVLAVTLASAWWFDVVISWMNDLPYAQLAEQAYAAFVTTWADGNYDTTMGYRNFGSRVLFVALLFALAGFGIWRRKTWGYDLAMLLAAIGLLEPALRLSAIEWFMPYSDSLGYQLDLQYARVAIAVASLPSAAIIATLLLGEIRRSVGKPAIEWRQFTLSSVATVTAVCAVLLSHMLSLAQTYGM